MIGILLPFVWMLSWHIEKEKMASYVQNIFWVAECAALVLLVATYSRWAIFSCICSIVVFDLIVRRSEKLITQAAGSASGIRASMLARWQAWQPALRQHYAKMRILLRTMKNAGLRISVLLIALITTNAWGRFSIAVQGDKSVTNRLTLWVGGTKMVVDRPIWGWGNGSAGLNYDNWYQDLASQTMHGTMVNSYLNIAVEWGLPALGSILFFLLSCLFLCYRLAGSVSPSGRGLLAGGGAMIAFFTLVNLCYSTIYNIMPLALLAAGTLLVAVFYCGRRRHIALSMPLLSAFSISLFCVLSIYLAGMVSRGKDPIRIGRADAGNVLLCKSGASKNTPTLTIVPDYRTLGVCYGQRIRKMFGGNMDYFNAIQVLEPGADLNNCEGERVIVLGARVGSWRNRAPKNNQGVILVCPTTPPAEQMKIKQLFLPQTDRWHVADAWKSWARQNKCPVAFLADDGILDEANFQKVIDYCIDS
jgi:hypothetical protein